ncbi:MAG: protoporphyrinogen oxidase [Gammaproteobacteria bacterium]|nr:protoporphyrinogen oxidase [Gammaproteobacteria bacterium]
MKITIVGAGISGLATAQAVLARKPDAEITIFESAPRVGGKVWTEVSAEGFLCEGGVNGFLDKIPRSLELCKEVGVAPLRADKSAQKRYVFSRGELHKLPEKPPEFLKSRLLTVPGRLRVIYEMIAGGTDDPDETLAQFATRRLGGEAFDRLIDPMASGVFAGNADELSLKSCFPRIHEIEMEHGSLIRGLIKLQIKAKREGSKNKPGPGPGGTLTSFENGMSALTDLLAEQLGSRIRIGSAVRDISRAGQRYSVQLDDGSIEESDRLILAAPAHAQAAMLKTFDPALSGLLGDIPYPALSVVCFGYKKQRVGQVLDGFGFLIPSKEQRFVLGTIVDSNVFPGRAPEDSILLRSMVGGARTPEFALLPDEQLIDRVRSDLQDILGISAEPDFIRIFRHERAIPQYVVGHAARLGAMDEQLLRHPGLILTGNAFKGVSWNDCVVNAEKTAGSLLPRTKRGTD